MKTLSAVLAFAVLGFTADAQQTASVQMECHDPATTNNFVGPDETLVNGMACHVVKQAKAQAATATQVVTTPKQEIRTTPADSTVSPGSAVNPVAQPTATPTAPTGPVNTKIVAGARVYITPMDGFDSYLAAALNKKKVPLVAVGDPAFADYVISGTSQDKKAGWAKIVFMGNIHSDNSASVTMSDKKTGAIVFAYAVDKKSTLHGQQTTAEACAKHLKNKIEDDSK